MFEPGSRSRKLVTYAVLILASVLLLLSMRELNTDGMASLLRTPLS